MPNNQLQFKEAVERMWGDQLNVALKNDYKYFMTYCLKKYLVDICPMKGAVRKMLFSTFFSARANWPTQKIQTSQTPPPPSRFLQITFCKYFTYMIKPKINHKLLAVLHHLKKKWTLFDKKSVQNDNLLLNIQTPLYFRS